ncbi:MAG: HlyD family efflux transporter periplasmic adaptor subunit [Phycisphaerales bacterium]|jgi:HlyD family secretion protein
MDIPRKFAKRRRYIRHSLYALVGLSAITLITVGVSRLKPAVPSVDRRTIVLGTVERGSMLRKVRGAGTLVSEDILWISAEVKGRVRQVLVEPGTPVKADTVILELSDPELDLELLDAKSKLDSAFAQFTTQKVNLEDLYLGKVNSLAQTEANYKQAKLDAEVDQKQFDKELISELYLTRSKTRVEGLERLLEIERRRFEMFRNQTIPAQLAEQEASLRQAISLYELKQRQVEALRVRAGKEGILARVSKEEIGPGQLVSAGTVVAKITNPKRLKAQLKIQEGQARDVRIGLSAEIDTYHGIVPGKVSRIDPTVMEGHVTIDVSLEGPLPKGARPDLSVTGTIEIERLDDVLYAGRPIFASADNTVELFKLVDEGKFAVRVQVRFGRASVTTIEILEGLEVNDQIILSDISQWDDVDRIRLK